MANPYNQLGKSYTDVLALYPGTATSDIAQAVLDAALNRAIRQTLASLSPIVWRNLTEPELELVERRATAGQTTVTLGYNATVASSWPIIANSVHIWRGQPATFSIRPALSTEIVQSFQSSYSGSIHDGSMWQGPVIELAADKFSVNATTGVVTLTDALAANDVVYATYRVDMHAAAYALVSVAEVALLGAAAEVGGQLFSNAQQEWKLVEDYRLRYEAWLKAATESQWVPDELRFSVFWKALDRVDNQGVGSLRLYRS